MADKYSERDDQVRGIADDETDAEFDDSEDLDEEDEAEDDEGSTF